MTPIFKAAAVAALTLTTPAHAAGDRHVRGEVVAIEDATVTVANDAGQHVDVTMSADYTLLLYTAIDRAAIEPGQYLAVPSAPAPGGAKRALAVIVFPEALRGLNEGDAEWDLVPGSRMTNATLSQVDDAGPDGQLVVTHGDTTETIEVPPSAPVVTFAPVADRRLEIGDNTILFATDEDGPLAAGMAGISADGSLPPL